MLTAWERAMLKQQRPTDPPEYEEIICKKCGRVIGEDETVYDGLCENCWVEEEER